MEAKLTAQAEQMARELASQAGTIDELNSLLRVDCSENTYIAQKVTSVTANGIPLTLAARDTGYPKPTDTSSWVLAGLPAGSVSIVASGTTGATHGYGVSCIARDYYGVDQASPIALVDIDHIPNNPQHNSVTCAVTPTLDGSTLSIFEYSSAYNQSAVTSAVPFATDFITGRFSGLQMGAADALRLIAGQPYTETWTEHNSTTSVEWSIIGLVLRPAS